VSADDAYELVVTPPAAGALSAQLPESVAAAVIELLTTTLIIEPRRIGKPLRGELSGIWSARRGTYRILYRIREDPPEVIVLRIEHRRDIYRRAPLSAGLTLASASRKDRTGRPDRDVSDPRQGPRGARWLGQQREPADSDAFWLDADNAALCKRVGECGKIADQQRGLLLRPSLGPSPEDNDRRSRFAPCRQQRAEVGVGGNDDAPFIGGAVKDLGVRSGLHRIIADVGGPWPASIKARATRGGSALSIRNFNVPRRAAALARARPQRHSATLQRHPQPQDPGSPQGSQPQPRRWQACQRHRNPQPPDARHTAHLLSINGDPHKRHRDRWLPLAAATRDSGSGGAAPRPRSTPDARSDRPANSDAGARCATQ
jgi:mRNA interferase RelE/StbE